MSAWGLAGRPSAAVAERLSGHFACLAEELALEDPVGAVHIFEGVAWASFPDNVHTDPSVAAGWDRAGASGAASREGDRVAARPGADDTSVDVDAWADGVLEYAVAGEEDHAWGARASAGARTSDAAGDGVAAAVTARPYRQDLDGACDADQAVKLGVEDPDWDRDDIQASFHRVVQLHCSRCSAET